jgi:hypothetical protein
MAIAPGTFRRYRDLAGGVHPIGAEQAVVPLSNEAILLESRPPSGSAIVRTTGRAA